MARELDVKGRSKMSRKDLEKAVEAATEDKAPAKKKAS
jgi:hypothetical protein